MQNLHIASLSNILLGLWGGASPPQECGSTGILRALKSVSELPHLRLEGAVIYFAHLSMMSSAPEGVECIKDAGACIIIKLHPGEPRGNCKLLM